MQLLMARGLVGAGDLIGFCNTANCWGQVHHQPVELEIHYREKEDFKVLPQDPETVFERLMSIHSKMQYHQEVDIEVIFDSDIFFYCGEEAETDPSIRSQLDYRRWFMSDAVEGQTLPFEGYGLRSVGGCHTVPPSVWKDKGTLANTIVFWDPLDNAQPLPWWKQTRSDWKYMQDYIRGKFPDHELIRLTYRDSFEDAYNAIQKCDFCFGYDGMWHIVADNFGKLVLTLDDDLCVNDVILTDPLLIRSEDFEKVIDSLTEENILKEKILHAAYRHVWRMKKYAGLKTTMNTDRRLM